MGETSGRCLCGAVRVTVDGAGSGISACFCENCRRWGGGFQMGIEAPADGVRIEGPVKVHRSSHLAERAWCDTCGSSLFLRDVEGPNVGTVELCPGLFEDFGGARLARIVYADRAPEGFTFTGDHVLVSQRAYEAENPHLNDRPEP